MLRSAMSATSEPQPPHAGGNPRLYTGYSVLNNNAILRYGTHFTGSEKEQVWRWFAIFYLWVLRAEQVRLEI